MSASQEKDPENFAVARYVEVMDDAGSCGLSVPIPFFLNVIQRDVRGKLNIAHKEMLLKWETNQSALCISDPMLEARLEDDFSAWAKALKFSEVGAGISLHYLKTALEKTSLSPEDMDT